ncbi:MAG: HNH endonuclease [Moorea sp. SIO3C2]|nr:HNH endonuclease [Moorena sp. SIO3C2]
MSEILLADDYDLTEFPHPSLLINGDIDVWIRRRAQMLVEKSQKSQVSCEASKSLSTAVIAAGVFMSANPLSIIPIALGGMGYIMTVFAERMDTGQFRLIPMIGGLYELLEIAGQIPEEEKIPQFFKEIAYLSPAEKSEIIMLTYKFNEISKIMRIVGGEVRFDIYRHACAVFHAAERIISNEEVTIYLETIAESSRECLPQKRPENPLFMSSGNLSLRPEKPIPVREASAMPKREQQLPVNQEQSDHKEKTVLSALLKNPYLARFVCGAQRSGKTYLVAIATKMMAAKGTKIYHINLASFGDEDSHYWNHCTRSISTDISKMDASDAGVAINEARSIVAEFIQEFNAILVFDEWVFAGSKNNMHVKALAPLVKLTASVTDTLTSSGIKRNQGVFLIAPFFVAGGVSEDTKVAKHCSLMLPAIAPGKTVDWNGNAVTFSEELVTQLKQNFPVYMPEGFYESDRICFINGSWMEMGEMPALDSFPSVKKKQKQSEDDPLVAMTEALRQTKHTTLWEFVTQDLTVDKKQIKPTLTAIAEMIFDDKLVDLSDKFQLDSPYDVRYSYAKHRQKLAQSHQLTGGMCSCCLENNSEEVHHTSYQGGNDKPGVNMFPVCKSCHYEFCHNDDNWIKKYIWDSTNTKEWKAKLSAGFKMFQRR